MAATYDLEFVWPYVEATDVIVTGTFDGWSSSLHLNRTPAGFAGSVALPWESKILYKFVVDGNWQTLLGHPIEVDPAGNVNNVAYTPEKPQPNASAEETPILPPTLVSEAEPADVPVPEAKEEPTVEASPADVKSDDAPVEMAPDLSIAIQPVLDSDTNTEPEPSSEPSVPDASTHAPSAQEPASEATLPPASEPVVEATSAVVIPEPVTAEEPSPSAEVTPAPEPAPEPVAREATEETHVAPSTPPPTKKELAPSAPVTPIKTDSAHERDSTRTTGSTAPSSSAPSTPKTKQSFPADQFEGGKRKKRLSILGKIKAALSPDRKKAPSPSHGKDKK
ncbi:hypothetical protein M0805_005424 [Coniferiporia weirii]|nr:hypothetical protein M0805_005424 [Coniferiporia weirii]